MYEIEPHEAKRRNTRRQKVKASADRAQFPSFSPVPAVSWEAVPLRLAFHARQSRQMDFARTLRVAGRHDVSGLDFAAILAGYCAADPDYLRARGNARRAARRCSIPSVMAHSYRSSARACVVRRLGNAGNSKPGSSRRSAISARAFSCVRKMNS